MASFSELLSKNSVDVFNAVRETAADEAMREYIEGQRQKKELYRKRGFMSMDAVKDYLDHTDDALVDYKTNSIRAVSDGSYEMCYQEHSDSGMIYNMRRKLSAEMLLRLVADDIKRIVDVLRNYNATHNLPAPTQEELDHEVNERVYEMGYLKDVLKM